MVIPELHTERLVLRGHRLDDLAASTALWSEPAVVRYISGRPTTQEEAWSRLLRYAGHWQLLGFGYWAVEERATGAFVGELGFADFKRTIEPPIGNVPEMGWVLMPHVHGRGYATEALTAASAWGEVFFGSSHAACLIDPENAASLRLAEKIGFRAVARTTYKDAPTILLRR